METKKELRRTIDQQADTIHELNETIAENERIIDSMYDQFAQLSERKANEVTGLKAELADCEKQLATLRKDVAYFRKLAIDRSLEIERASRAVFTTAKSLDYVKEGG